MSDKTITDYRDLPPDLKQHLSALEDLISDLDGKTLCTEGTDEGDNRVFYDEGVVVAEDYVEHFNGIVAAFRAAVPPIPKGIYWSREAGNFYDATTNRGMGLDFYRKWEARKDEFPVKATTSAGIDINLDNTVRQMPTR